MNKLLVIIIASAVLLFSCEKSPVTFPVSKKQQNLIDADNNFGFELLKQINASSSYDKNLFISPLSVSMALSMTMNGAKGTTLDGMKAAMQVPSLTTTEINEINKFLLDKLLSLDPKVALSIANSIWYNQGFSVLPDFLNVNKDYYYAQVNELNFSDPLAIDVINGWVSDQTNKKIPKIINQIDPEDVMFLINAIYFKGEWTNKFDKSKTSDGDFELPTGDIKSVPFMNQKVTARYCENDKYQALELPYGKKNYNMIIMLPKDSYTINNMITDLNTNSWNDLKNSLTQTDNINVKLPKFKFEYELNMNDVLSAMGMQEAFSDHADFTGINPAGNLYISEVIHKSFVEVNEEGTEAAAATSVGISFTSMPQEVWFLANKPFLFFITEKNTSCILFIGKITNPK